MPQLLLAGACPAPTGLVSLADAIARVEARLDAWAADTAAYNHLLLQVLAAAGTEPARWQQSAGELKHSLQSSGPAIRLDLGNRHQASVGQAATVFSDPGHSSAAGGFRVSGDHPRPCRRLAAPASPPQGRHFLVRFQMIHPHQLSAGFQRVKPS
jgi:hypothetical protein